MDRHLLTPLGVHSLCAKIWHALTTSRPSAEGQVLPPPSERIARDIGLTQAEAERLRIKWPSQTTRHPYL